MDYIGVSDLKHSKDLWRRLAEAKEVVLTRDGKPGALIIEVTPDSLEQVLTAYRRALFSEAVSSARCRAGDTPATEEDLERELATSRK